MAEKDCPAEKDFYIDPNCECDAPTYVDFTELVQKSNQYDDNADEWFDNRVVDEGFSSQVDENDSSQCVRETFTVDEGTTKDVKEPTPPDVSLPTKKEGVSMKMLTTANRIAQLVNKGAGSKQKTKETKVPSQDAEVTYGNGNPPVKLMGKRQRALPTEPTEEAGESKRIRIEAKRRLAKSRQSSSRSVSGPMRALARSRSLVKDQGSSSKTGSSSDVVEVKPCEFASTLRSDYNPKKPATPIFHTKVRPFKFECEKRAGLRSAGTVESSSTSSRVPMAEFITKYQTSTPPRFRRSPTTPGPNKTRLQETDGQYGLGAHITMPKTPNLLTKTRKRPVTVKGAKEIEEEEALKMKHLQFKAKPLNRSVIDKDGLYGVPRKRSIQNLTQPKSPNITKRSGKKRRTVYEEVQQSEDSDRKFRAKPMPDFKEITGVPAKRVPPLTEAESPAIVKSFRHYSSFTASDGDESMHKAKPMPNFDKMFMVKYPDRPVLLPQPFHFEEREKNKPAPKPPSDEKFVFTAQPVPDFSKPSVPTKHMSSPTRPAPFSLHTEIRGEQHTTKWKKELEEKMQHEKEEAEFKAKKNVSAILYGKPFIPEKSRKPLVHMDNFVLHSDVRSNQRFKYDSAKRQRCYLLEIENLQRRALREAEEAKEVAEYRKTLVHKAQPISHYAPTLIKPSDKPITQPFSPKFETDHVLRSRHL